MAIIFVYNTITFAMMYGPTIPNTQVLFENKLASKTIETFLLHTEF